MLNKNQKDLNKIALFLPNLCGGGAEKVMVSLANQFVERNKQVDLVLGKAVGINLKKVSEKVKIIDLRARFFPLSIFPLMGYLKKEKPEIVLSAIEKANIIAIWARMLSSKSSKNIASCHNNLSTHYASVVLYKRIMRPLIRKFYPYADCVIAVSQGVADDLEQYFHLPKSKLWVIYNPIVDEELIMKSQDTILHSWYKEKQVPVILGVGRLTKQKDFSTLIKAFSLVRQRIPAKLVILGEGENREMLERLIRELGLENDVDLPGFVENPYSFMKRSDVFVLSSQWEGFGNVLVEAMACGCPVVSTNCPSGPAEILEDGEYGIIVPVGDVDKIAEGIVSVLNSKALREELSNKALKRANEFSVEKAVDKYLQIFSEVAMEK